MVPHLASQPLFDYCKLTKHRYKDTDDPGYSFIACQRLSGHFEIVQDTYRKVGEWTDHPLELVLLNCHQHKLHEGVNRKKKTKQKQNPTFPVVLKPH